MNGLKSFKTGDILLYNNHSGGWFGTFTNLIKWGTHSNYTHVALVLKDPTFINSNLRGLYVWESTYDGHKDPQDGKVKFGVKLTPLHESLAFEDRSVFLRRLSCPEGTFNEKTLKEVHKVVYDKPYDVVLRDWIEAFFQVDDSPQKTDRFWCSALVGYIYTKCGILSENTDWSKLRPCDFSLSSENLSFNSGFGLGNIEEKIQ